VRVPNFCRSDYRLDFDWVPDGHWCFYNRRQLFLLCHVKLNLLSLAVFSDGYINQRQCSVQDDFHDNSFTISKCCTFVSGRSPYSLDYVFRDDVFHGYVFCFYFAISPFAFVFIAGRVVYIFRGYVFPIYLTIILPGFGFIGYVVCGYVFRIHLGLDFGYVYVIVCQSIDHCLIICTAIACECYVTVIDSNAHRVSVSDSDCQLLPVLSHRSSPHGL
jgi:hypothetical protein